jgi:hypothetical protein
MVASYRAVVVPAHLAVTCRAGTVGQECGLGTALCPGRARHGHDGSRAGPCQCRAF